MTKIGLSCSGCGGKTRVADSRPDDGSIFRRRECVVGCGVERFTTHEFRTGARTQRRTLPDNRPSVTHKFKIDSAQGSHSCYLTVGLYEDGTPGEVFIRIGKMGSSLNGLLDTVGILISYGLQFGVPLGDLCGKLRGMNFEPMGPTSNDDQPMCSSIIDYLFGWLAAEYGPFEPIAPTSPLVTPGAEA